MLFDSKNSAQSAQKLSFQFPKVLPPGVLPHTTLYVVCTYVCAVDHSRVCGETKMECF